MSGWPGLGFDPAPGDPDVTMALAARLLGAADTLDGAVRELASLLASGGRWTGPAADAFAARIGALPGALDEARDALGRAGGVLRGWAGSLRGARARAWDLEILARAARAGSAAVHDAATGLVAPAATGAGSAAPPGSAAAPPGSAAAERGPGPADLDAVLAQARALRDEHAAGTARAADEIRRGAGQVREGRLDAHTGHEPRRPAGTTTSLGEVGDVAAAVAGIAGALAFVPVLTPAAAPVALVAGAVALGADVADTAVTHRWSDRRAVTHVAVDALALIPGVRFAKGLVPAAAAAADVASATFRSVEGLTPTVAAGASLFARGEAAASAVYRQPGVWAMLQARAAARWSPIPVDTAARGLEVAGRAGRAVRRLAGASTPPDEGAP